MPKAQQSDADSLNSPARASVLQALTPVSVLIALLSFSVYLFGEDASYGPNQIALIIGAAVAAFMGWRNGQTWEDIEASIVSGITVSLKPILIPFSVGHARRNRILGGTAPAMIYYSSANRRPSSVVRSATCIICAVGVWLLTTVLYLPTFLTGVAVVRRSWRPGS